MLHPVSTLLGGQEGPGLCMGLYGGGWVVSALYGGAVRGAGGAGGFVHGCGGGAWHRGPPTLGSVHEGACARQGVWGTTWGGPCLGRGSVQGAGVHGGGSLCTLRGGLCMMGGSVRIGRGQYLV